MLLSLKAISMTHTRARARTHTHTHTHISVQGEVQLLKLNTVDYGSYSTDHFFEFFLVFHVGSSWIAAHLTGPCRY